MPKKSAIYGEVKGTNGGSTQLVPIEPNAVIPSLSALSGKANYAPERLDDVIEVLIQNTEACGGMLLQYTPVLADLMGKLQRELKRVLARLALPPDDGEVQPGVPQEFEAAVRLADKVSVILMRINAMTNNAVKAKDGATRLQVFLKEDQTDTSGLDGLSENQLRKIISDAAAGWVKPDNV